MEVREGIFTYDIRWEKYGEAIGFVVVENENTLLFGSGVEPMTSRLSPIVDEHDVDIVVVEHGDRDHYEGAPQLRADHGVEIAVPAGDVDRSERAGVEPDHPLEMNRTYWGVETIPVPGHTPGNAAYLADDVLIAGDTVIGKNSVFAADGRWQGPLAILSEDYNDDHEAAKANVERLLDYDFDTVVVAHGANVVEGGFEAVEKLVADLREEP